MHGLALKAVELFVTEIHGSANWSRVLQHAGFDFNEFEAMLEYDDCVAHQTISALEHVLERPGTDILEDLGTFLVSNPVTESLRRLLRFGGVTFEDFLHSLNELPDRARLAVEELHLPRIELREHSSYNFSLSCNGNIPGFGHVMAGILRTMADDYGALATVEHRGGGQGVETVAITLLERTYASGRDFDLGAQVA